MKRIMPAVVLLAAIRFSCFSQGVVLNAGDVFTFELNNFNLESQLPVPTAPYARVLLGKQGFTGAFLFEAFESSVAEPPLFATNIVAGVNPSSDFRFGPAWQDLQGVFQVTMQSGSMTIPVVLGAVVTSSGDVYSQSVTPVPEPSALVILVAGAAPLLLLHQRKSAPVVKQNTGTEPGDRSSADN